MSCERVETGHRVGPDPNLLLRNGDHGMAVARAFFSPLAEHYRNAMADLPDEDLAAAHRVLAAMIHAMKAFQGDLGYAGRAAADA
jgi:hypothetical protein